jgi:hypothetical protein
MEKINVIESLQPCSGQYSWKADLKLNRWFFVATVLWLLAQILTKQIPQLSVWGKATLAMVPLIPGLLYVRSCVRFIRHLDELQRQVQIDAFLFAALGTVLCHAAVNTLNATGVGVELWPHGLGIGATVATMFVLWLVGGALANCRYK